jgi:hypothetical protein
MRRAMDPNTSGGPSDAGRRRVLSLIARVAIGLSARSLARVALRTLAGGAAAGLATTPAGIAAAGAPATVLAYGSGPEVDGGTLLRGCSATASAVERFGGRLPPGLAIDFARRTALLLTGLDPARLAIDPTTGGVSGSPSPAWALVAVDGRAHDLRRSWRIRVAGRIVPVALETNGG